MITHEVMVIRQCAMKTMDSQCGEFKYQENTMNGCILTCDFDGCNAAPSRRPRNAVLQIAVPALTLALAAYYTANAVGCFQIT